MKALEEERKKLQAELAKRREEFMAKGKAILAEMAGKTSKEIRAKMAEAEIPDAIIHELAPSEAAPAAGGAKKK